MMLVNYLLRLFVYKGKLLILPSLLPSFLPFFISLLLRPPFSSSSYSSLYHFFFFLFTLFFPCVFLFHENTMKTSVCVREKEKERERERERERITTIITIITHLNNNNNNTNSNNKCLSPRGLAINNFKLLLHYDFCLLKPKLIRCQALSGESAGD